MDFNKTIITGALLFFICLTIFISGLLLIYFFHIEGMMIPGQYYVAFRDESPPDHPAVIHGYNLTDEDMASHPALDELINHRKRVLFSLDPRQVLAVALEWSEYSWVPISGSEDRYLSQYQEHIVQYNGSRSYIERHAWIPSQRKCGKGMQC